MLYKVPFFDNDDIFKENQIKMHEFDVERIKKNSKIKFVFMAQKERF